MKSFALNRFDSGSLSLPARGAWIEISSHLLPSANSRSLPARGAWIEIPSSIARRMLRPGRSPQGERGLKSDVSMPYITEAESLPARGAWIEIRPDRDAKTRRIVAPRRGSVD